MSLPRVRLWFTWVPAALLLGGCSGDGDGTSLGPPEDVSGPWSIDAVLSVGGGSATCNDHSTVTLAQDGGSLSGTLVQLGACVTSSGPTGAHNDRASLTGTT